MKVITIHRNEVFTLGPGYRYDWVPGTMPRGSNINISIIGPPAIRPSYYWGVTVTPTFEFRMTINYKGVKGGWLW